MSLPKVNHHNLLTSAERRSRGRAPCGESEVRSGSPLKLRAL